MDSHSAQYYDTLPNVDAIRACRRSGLPLSGLSAEDRYNLACWCFIVRQFLMPFFVGVDALVEVSLNKEELAAVLVPGIVSNFSQTVSFRDYIVSTFPGLNEAVGDARNVKLPPTGYEPPTDPVICGRTFKEPVLIDGFHRAALFWKFASPDDRLPAYMPELFCTSLQRRWPHNGSGWFGTSLY